MSGRKLLDPTTYVNLATYYPDNQIKDNVIGVAREMYGGWEYCTRYVGRNQKEREHLEILGLDGSVLKRIPNHLSVRGLDWSGSSLEQLEGFCDRGVETYGFIEWGEFFDQLRNLQLLKEDCAPCR